MTSFMILYMPNRLWLGGYRVRVAIVAIGVEVRVCSVGTIRGFIT